MIERRQGNLLDVVSGILVQGCNCQGVMGSGLALQIKEKWPDVQKVYKEHQAKTGLHLGDVVFLGGNGLPAEVEKYVYAYSNQLPPALIVANAMTQFNYGRDKKVRYADYDAISAAFSRINMLARHGLPVHIPLIGCGLANGLWDEVSLRIEAAMHPKARVILWEYTP